MGQTILGLHSCPISRCMYNTCSTVEIQEKVRIVQDRLRRTEGELDEGQEERIQKYSELRSKEKMITGQHCVCVCVCVCVYIVLMFRVSGQF